MAKEGTETLWFSDWFIGISKDRDTGILLGKTESKQVSILVKISVPNTFRRKYWTAESTTV